MSEDAPQRVHDLGDGLQLFEHAALDRIDLETIGVDTVGQRTGLRYRIVR